MVAMLLPPLFGCGGGPVLVEQRHDNGQPSRVGTLVAGRQQGEWTLFHPNGVVAARGPYADDVRTGNWSHWYSDGQLRMSGRYDRDRQQGEWQFFHPNGRLHCRGLYRDGREFGEWTFCDPSGAVQQRGCLLDGRRVLRWVGHHADGRLKSAGWYHDGEPVGCWTFHDASGARSTVDHGLPRGQGIVHDTWDDGSSRREGFLCDGVPTGLWVTRHRGGALRLVGAFAAGHAVGEFAAFGDDGSLLGMGPVQHGRPTGRWCLHGEHGERTIELGDRPFPPWNGEWTDAAIVRQQALEDVVATWLQELRGKAAPLPPPPRSSGAGVPSAMLLERQESPEAPVDPGAFTVREQAELARYRRYYRDGWLPRQHQIGAEYGVAGSSRRLGQGDRARAEALIGKPVPVTRFQTHDGRVLDLDRLRGRKVLLVILRGFTTQVCVYCFAQTAELAPLATRFAELETEVVVVYPGSKGKLQAFLQVCADEFGGEGPPYHMVYDPDLALSAALGISGNLARPSALVIDAAGVIRHAYVAESEQNIADRPPAMELLELLRDLAR